MDNNGNSVNEAAFDEQLDHLYRFAGTVGSTLRVDLLIKDALLPLLSIAQGDKVLISLCKMEGAESFVFQHIGFDNAPRIEVLPDDAAHLNADPAKQAAQGADALPAWVVEVAGGQVRNPAAVPLWAYGHPLGFMLLSREKPFDSRTLRLLHTAGRQLGLAVENARLFGDLEMSYHHLLYNQEEMISSERMAAVGSLAATMAHEIRNPLATIFSSLSQIKKHAHVTGDAATLLDIAEEEAMRMNRIVSGLLEFARPGVPRIDRVSLLEIAKNVMDEASRLIDAKSNVQVVLEADTSGLDADVDPGMVKKALHHVLENAVAAVDPQKGRILVKLIAGVEQHHKKDVVKIFVEDNGHGVTREIQNKVFEPFYSTKPSGIGLGLPTVARIVNDHGGMVGFDSQYRQGTTVVLTFFKEHRAMNENRASE